MTAAVMRHTGLIRRAFLLPLALLASCILPAAETAAPPDAAAASAAGDTAPDFFRISTCRDLAESLEQFKERDYFERLTSRVFTDGMPADKFVFALLYHHGLGTPRDTAKAARWYEESLREGGGHPGFAEKAAEALAALREETAAGREQDAVMAPDEAAAAAGGGAAQLRLASRYWRGLCAPLDWEKAMRWEIRAAESGDPRAIEIVTDNFFSGNYAYPRDPARVRPWLEQLTEEGNTYAGVILGDLLRTDPLKPDYAAALRLYEKAAESGHNIAWGRLLLMYQNGLGTEPDEEKLAFLRNKLDHFKTAAAAMESGAARPLSEYAEAVFREGLEKYSRADSPEAYLDAAMSLADAAGLGAEIPENHYLLGLIQAEGRCGPPNLYAAGNCFRTAALLGHGPAMMRLARLHEDGTGVRRSLRQAARWYARAAELGEEGAREESERLAGLLTPDHREEWEQSPAFRQLLEEARQRRPAVPVF